MIRDRTILTMPAWVLALTHVLVLASVLAFATGSTPCNAQVQKASTGVEEASVGTGRRPNIVLLLADDLGFTDIGAFGSEIATPHLDELARRGVRFSNFHVSASCSPSRAMLLTGVDHHRNGVGNMRETIPQAHVGRPGYLTVLDTNVVTIASLLRDSGYRTYVAGKWHVGKEPYNLPPQRGFDRSIIQGDSGSDNWETARRYLDLSDQVDWFEDGAPASMPKEYYSSQYFVDRAIEYIGSGAVTKKPFFAYIAFQANHIPLQAPPEFIARYKGRYDDGWTTLRQQRRDRAAALGLIPRQAPMNEMPTTTSWSALSGPQKQYEARRMEVYAGMAEAMDHQIGRLIAHLKETGEFENTVFLFLSDNGPEASDPYAVLAARLWLAWQYNRDLDRLGSKGSYAVMGPSWASAAASPLSTYKFYSGEGGIRVPLIVSGVNGIHNNPQTHPQSNLQTKLPTNRIHDSFSHVNDIAPTLLELAGVPRPDGTYQGRKVEVMTGQSLLPVIRAESDRVHAEDKAIGYELSGNQALFKGDLKLIRNIAPLGDGQWHLYDIRKDPGETEDLQQRLPQMFQTMQREYEQYAKDNGVLPMPDGYDPIRQVTINALVNVYWPRAQRAALPTLAVLAVIAMIFGAVAKNRRKNK